MILIVGGKGSGKLDYARDRFQLGADDIAVAALDDRPVLHDLHELLRDDSVAVETVLACCTVKRVVICAEVGCGIVPLDPAERAWRDRVGKACAMLAVEADEVVRLVCGIPQLIKGGAK